MRHYRSLLPGVDVVRGYQSRGGGAEAPDVCIADMVHVEAKRGRRPSPRAAYLQAAADVQPGRVPVAITRGDREGALVTMAQDLFDEMLTAWLARVVLGE